MGAKLNIGKAKAGCSYVPDLSEVVQYQYDSYNDLWDIRIGDGKTPVKDLPRLANYDIYERVSILEEEVAKLKNDRRI